VRVCRPTSFLSSLSSRKSSKLSLSCPRHSGHNGAVSSIGGNKIIGRSRKLEQVLLVDTLQSAG
jgi:hypothetical protein